MVSGSVSDGVSGGPLLNRQNQLVAVCWGSVKSGIYGIPLPRVRAFLQGLLPGPAKPLVLVKPRVIATDTTPAATPSVPAVEPKESAECAELRARIVALENLVAALKCDPVKPLIVKRVNTVTGEEMIEKINFQNGENLVLYMKPLIIKRVNTVTGEEVIEEINFQDGEGLIFLMTPHE